MIYLDNAATTFPKPRSVRAAVESCLKTYGGNPGRGSHALSLAAAEKVYECRERLSDFFGLGLPENIVFTMNTTYALNMAVKGVLRGGDHVLLSDLEHNSVFRPIRRLADDGKIKFDIFSTLTGLSHTDEEICDGIIRLLTPRTRMIVCTHASNICSAVLPAAKIGRLCRERGIIFVLDAAQSAGHLPINMREMCVDILCLPGHKGLYGIQGCGAMLLGEGITGAGLKLLTLTEGGNGVNSLESEMPDLPPERYESGTLPTPAVVALGEGLREISAIGTEAIHAHERGLFLRLADRLSCIPGVTVYDPSDVGSVLLFNLDGKPADFAAAELDRRGICVRGGYHCSALGHKTLSTPPGGAVRAAFGIFNRPSDIDALANAVGEICAL